MALDQAGLHAFIPPYRASLPVRYHSYSADATPVVGYLDSPAVPAGVADVQVLVFGRNLSAVTTARLLLLPASFGTDGSSSGVSLGAGTSSGAGASISPAAAAATLAATEAAILAAEVVATPVAAAAAAAAGPAVEAVGFGVPGDLPVGRYAVQLVDTYGGVSVDPFQVRVSALLGGAFCEWTGAGIGI